MQELNTDFVRVLDSAERYKYDIVWPGLIVRMFKEGIAPWFPLPLLWRADGALVSVSCSGVSSWRV